MLFVECRGSCLAVQIENYKRRKSGRFRNIVSDLSVYVILQTPLRDLKRTRNLEAYVQWFNRLSYLVATETCMQLKKRHRVRMLDYFIDVAKECFNLGNFNSLMAIIAGLNMNPVGRLKRTWAKVNIQKFEILEHQMDPSGNFNSYRSTLKAAMWRSEGASTDKEKVSFRKFLDLIVTCLISCL